VGLAFERFGSGEPLVLLHGLGHRRQAWGAVAGLLAPFRDVVVVDLPGHGQSPPLRVVGEPAVRVLLGEVVGVLDGLGWGRPHVAGSSLGGRLALELGVRGRAASVTALSPAGFWTRGRELVWVRGVFGAMCGAGVVLRPAGAGLAGSVAGRAVMYAAAVARPSRVSAGQAAGDMAAFVRARPAVRAILAEAFPFAGRVPAGVPVTIGWGTRDVLLPPRQALVAAARLPGARVVWLPGCGHVPMTDDPDLVAEVLLAGSRVPAPAPGPGLRGYPAPGPGRGAYPAPGAA
jgi:pimeloyl-ACP methyl ester carboxylesterase